MPAPTQSRTAIPKLSKDNVSIALERTLSRYAAAVKGAARRHGLAESEIDDVFQDVRIRLWRALSTGEKISVAPASYVYRTAVSAAMDLIRRRRARREDPVDWLESGFAAHARWNSDCVLEVRELADQLAQALANLNESRRGVVRMHLVGYHRSEIAEILGWTEAKTRNLLYRGLADLKARLGNGQSERT